MWLSYINVITVKCLLIFRRNFERKMKTNRNSVNKLSKFSTKITSIQLRPFFPQNIIFMKFQENGFIKIDEVIGILKDANVYDHFEGSM